MYLTENFLALLVLATIRNIRCYSSFNKKATNFSSLNFVHDVKAGCVQSLECLKKHGNNNLQTSLSDLKKIWKIRIKSGENGKKSGVLFKAATSI